MMSRNTVGKYPRFDTMYKTKSSLDFDLMKTKIMGDRKKDGLAGYSLWTAHIVCGFMMGVVGWIYTWLENNIVLLRVSGVQEIINLQNNSLVGAYFFYAGTAVGFVFIASWLTIYVGPGAMGSGIPEVMGFLNGVNYDGAISISTFIIKIFGTLFAMCGGLCIGSEGPLVHMGAIVGVLSCYLPV